MLTSSANTSIVAASHEGRAHSEYSPSGAYRWTKCGLSVSLSRGLPDRDNKHSLQGTYAHETVEVLMRHYLFGAPLVAPPSFLKLLPENIASAKRGAEEIVSIWQSIPGNLKEAWIEARVYLTSVSPKFFGSSDAIFLDAFDTLHVIDFKNGKHFVNPTKNLQLTAYAIGAAELVDWAFSRVKLWVVQPRAANFSGAICSQISARELENYVDYFRGIVENIETKPQTPVEGEWCFFCKAKSICPAKQKKQLEDAKKFLTATR